MLNSISWSEYFSAVCVLLVIYYAVVVYLYFKAEVLALVGITMIEPAPFSATRIDELHRSFGSESDEEYIAKSEGDVDLSPIIQSFKNEISAYVLSAADEKPIREEALYAIELIAAKYPVLNDTDCRTELLEYVYQETEATLPSLFEPQDFKHLFVS